MLAPGDFAHTVVQYTYADASPEFKEAAHKLLKKAWEVRPKAPNSNVNQVIRSGSSRYLNSKVVAYCYTAVPHVENRSTVRGLCQEVADDEGVDEKTVWKWLCGRNPIYEAGAASEPERYNRLSAAIKCIVMFTETP